MTLNRDFAATQWPFEAQGLTYLNHGSFGAVPLPVQRAEDKLRAHLRANPFDALVFEHGGLWSQAGFGLMEENRRFLAEMVGADPDGLVLTSSATEGVNAVFGTLRDARFFRRTDEILVTSFGYNACNNVAEMTAQQTGAQVKVVHLPFPLESPEQIQKAILHHVTDRTKFAMIDHISSIQAAIFPIEEIVAGLKEREVPVLVDGAHALAQVPLDLKKLGADFYVGNCHKWFCAPPGSGFLSVAKQWRGMIHPPVVSHGYNDPSTELSSMVKMFNWTGTKDYSSLFVLRETKAFLDSLSPRGLWDVVASNKSLVREGCAIFEDVLGWKPTVPDSMMGTMATFLMPPCDAQAVKTELREKDGIVTQLLPNAVNGQSVLRISAHAYNKPEQYEKLARAVKRIMTP